MRQCAPVYLHVNHPAECEPIPTQHLVCCGLKYPRTHDVFICRKINGVNKIDHSASEECQKKAKSFYTKSYSGLLGINVWLEVQRQKCFIFMEFEKSR